VYAEIVRDKHNRTDRAIKVSWNIELIGL